VLATAIDLMEQDMARLCGKPFARKLDADLCHRGGSEETSLMLAGAKYPMRRPRARKAGQEVELPSMAGLRDRELLDTQMLARMMKGVSTRNYESVIDGFAEKTGISKSSVSQMNRTFHLGAPPIYAFLDYSRVGALLSNPTDYADILSSREA